MIHEEYLNNGPYWHPAQIQPDTESHSEINMFISFITWYNHSRLLFWKDHCHRPQRLYTSHSNRASCLSHTHKHTGMNSWCHQACEWNQNQLSNCQTMAPPLTSIAPSSPDRWRQTKQTQNLKKQNTHTHTHLSSVWCEYVWCIVGLRAGPAAAAAPPTVQSAAPPAPSAAAPPSAPSPAETHTDTHTCVRARTHTHTHTHFVR